MPALPWLEIRIVCYYGQATNGRESAANRTTWQYLSQLNASVFFSLQKIAVNKCTNFCLELVTPYCGWSITDLVLKMMPGQLRTVVIKNAKQKTESDIRFTTKG
jgi:hypothetical protein